jgi:hypothetical protein
LHSSRQSGRPVQKGAIYDGNVGVSRNLLRRNGCGIDAGAKPGSVLTLGLIGDIGYGPAEEPLLQNVLDDLNRNVLTFVVHVGDLSSAAYGCTDDVVARRFALRQRCPRVTRTLRAEDGCALLRGAPSHNAVWCEPGPNVESMACAAGT